MTRTDRIAFTFSTAMHTFARSRSMRLLGSGQLRVPHYISILRQIHFQARENPQLQALAAVRFRGADRGTVKMFLKHATSEIGHDQLALDDLRTLGVDVGQIQYEFSLPETTALTAFAYYTIEHRNPLGYLGYLYFLEHMPTASGGAYLEALRAAGVPDAAMTFLQEHVTVDHAHNRLLDEYLNRLIHTTDDETAVNYAIIATGRLYAAMLDAAITAATEPFSFGLDPLEVARQHETALAA